MKSVVPRVKSGERVDSSVIPTPKSQSVGKLIEVDDGDKGKEKNWEFPQILCYQWLITQQLNSQQEQAFINCALKLCLVLMQKKMN